MERVLDVEGNICQREKIRAEGLGDLHRDEKLAEYTVRFKGQGRYWLMPLEPNEGKVAPIFCSRYHTQMDNPWETSESEVVFYSEYPNLFMLIMKDDMLVFGDQVFNGAIMEVDSHPVKHEMAVTFGKKKTPLVIEPHVKLEALAGFLGRRVPHSKHVKCAALCPMNPANHIENLLEAARGLCQCHINAHIEMLRRLTEEGEDGTYKEDCIGGQDANSEKPRKGSPVSKQADTG